MDLGGRVALVTGAQQGIGAAVALGLGARGATVVVNYLDDEPAVNLASVAAYRGSPLGTHYNVPLGAMATPSEIADAVRFLLSGAAGHITGQVPHVNGGSYFG